MSPRRKPAVRRGLVLGGGGVLGVSWIIGALAALEETTGWDPREAEVLVGTSAGSILSAFLGAGIGVTSMLNHQRGIVAPGDPVIEYDVESQSSLPMLPRLRLGSSRLLLRTALHPTRVPPMGAMSGFLPRGRTSLAPVHGLVESLCGDAWVPHPATWLVAMDYDRGRRVAFGRPGAPEASIADAVSASCAIPGWYTPVEIGGRSYVDGGTCSPTSLDLVAGLELDEVYVLSPMTSFEFDAPRSQIARLERRFRRMVTRRLVREAEKVRAGGTKVMTVCPGPEDLEAIGANLMDPRRRTGVLETSLETSRAELSRQLSAYAATG